MNGLLNGINVLDFGRAAVGPWAASLLGSMGANVIRVESPDGDAMVIQRPLQRGYGVAYTIYNANKKGLILDLKSPDSKPHLRRLVEKADLIIENLTPGALERIGAGYDAAKAMNPNIVYASCPGWGYTGPIKDLAARATPTSRPSVASPASTATRAARWRCSVIPTPLTYTPGYSSPQRPSLGCWPATERARANGSPHPTWAAPFSYR